MDSNQRRILGLTAGLEYARLSYSSVRSYKMYNPLSLVFRRRRSIKRVFDDISSINIRISALSKQLTELTKAYEKHNEHSESVRKALEAQLMSKSAFIEKLLERSLTNGIDHAHDKAKSADGGLIDISKLSPTTQAYIKTQVEKAAKPNGAAKTT